MACNHVPVSGQIPALMTAAPNLQMPDADLHMQVSPEDSGSFTDFLLSDGEAEVSGQAAQDSGGAVDSLYGCEGCSFTPAGCGACRQGTPVMERPRALRWKPEEGHHQQVCRPDTVWLGAPGRRCKVSKGGPGVKVLEGSGAA